MHGRSVARIAAFISTLTVTLTYAAGLAGADQETPTPSAEPSTSATADPPSSSPPSSAPSAPSSADPSLPASANRSEHAKPAEPAPPKAADTQPNLDVDVKFGKAAYTSGEQFSATVTVKNVGESPVTVRALEQFPTSADFVLDYPSWGPLAFSGKGVPLAPSESVAATVTGHQRNAEATSVQFAGDILDPTGLHIKHFAASFAITRTDGRIGGLVFGDKNNNGQADPGEELGGVTLSLGYRWGPSTFTTGTDHAGRFSLPAIPTGAYFLSGTAPDGWRISSRAITVDQSDRNEDLRIRAVKPLHGELAVQLRFTQDTYKVGDIAHVTVTLANSGSGPVTGIVANCNRVGNGDELTGKGPGWGDLAADGVTVAAGETKILDVTEAVPQAAFTSGRLFVACDFGYAGVENPESDPSDFDSARVPGGIGGIVGDIMYTPPSGPRQPIPGVRVVLTNHEHCPIVAETTTDANGVFEFTNLPVGPDYTVFMFPPAGWKAKFGDLTSDALVFDGAPARLGIEFVPGDATPPTLPTQPADCAPPAQGSPPAVVTPEGHAGLASTGADVIGLSRFGAVVLLVGVATVMYGRRRSHRSTGP
ncbi:SdrD B-like domain-containing protein [Actinocrispum wychmicini]|uniref:SdrD B-like protein n=1 Tax=Actinocrispum wychmicini TaxID=1213861 RepID=A0A4R2JVE4_9PSEU|nr:SdrD B-like domain-containing protein [Actinocrispum wychmicini]TCO64431.1 SdrD B-like protein [Actinocrispum wychmicini]